MFDNLPDNWNDYVRDCRFCGTRHHVTDCCADEPGIPFGDDECDAPEPVETDDDCRDAAVGFGAVEAF